MAAIESEEEILYQLEAIDIENNEYIFWDATGAGVSIQVHGGRVVSVIRCAAESPLTAAVVTYAAAHGVQTGSTGRTPVELWGQIQSELRGRPSKKGILSRLFSRQRSG
jgi:hypothetical protein